MFGHSYGGMVAQAFAIKYPDSVRRLILASTSYSAEMDQAPMDANNLAIKNHFPGVWTNLVSFRERGVSPLSPEWTTVASQIPASFFFNADFSNSVELLQEVTPKMYYAMFGKDADFTVGGEFKDFDFRPALRKLTIPVLVLAGRMDRMALPRFSEEYRSLIPHCEFVMFEKSGHNLFQEENAKMIQVLRDFLK